MNELQPVHFLLVDDLEENLLSLEALLRREGLILLKARSGPEALELLLKHDVALALLDVQMPGMDGFELAELMRGSGRTKGVPIIFLTAGGDDRQRRFRGYEAGAVDFLHKPIEADILRSKAKVFYDLYRQRQMLAQQAEENAILLKESRRYLEALKAADILKDEFLATLAHELRNPLAPIRNGLQIMRADPNKKMSMEVLDMMYRQMTHLVRLIDDLLDVSRITQGKIMLRKEIVTLQNAIQSAIEVSRPLIDNAHHTLAVRIPEESIWIEGDLTRFSQIISNILNNAAKYTPDEGRIILSVRMQGKEVAISVVDNGLGIDADMIPRVFDLFTQIGGNLNRTQGGLGIGLALVKKLVQMHGGRIEAQSEGLGKGSTFTIYLPVADAPAQSILKAPEKKAPKTSLNILVVDDNKDSAQTMGWMLEAMGHEFMIAHDGFEALEVAKQQKPDVILLDIGLPKMNGYDVCREMRKDPVLKGTMIIAQTGWGQDSDRQQAKDAGFDHHLIKPVGLASLTALLDTVTK